MRIAILEHHLWVPETEAIPLARELGFDGLELSFGAQGPDERLIWHADGPERIRQLAAEHQVALCSMSAGYFNRHGLIDPRPERRQLQVEVLARLIDACAGAGIPLLQIPSYAANEIRGPAEARLLAEVIGPLVERAETRNVRLAFETLLPVEEMCQFLDRFRGSAVWAGYDVGNSRAVGRDVVGELRLLKGRLGHVHLKDRDRREPFASVPLGEGTVDWPGVLRALAELGYSGWLVLDTPAGDDPVVSARTNLEYLHKLMPDRERAPTGQAAA